MTPTRGERNKNPGNLDRNGTVWQGMCKDQSSDPRFVVFESDVYGIRAMAKILLTYYRKYDLSTIRQIISRWAPPNENDTESYIQCVCKDMNLADDYQAHWENPEMLEDLVRAIIRHENGRCLYSKETIAQGVERALA